MARNNELIRVAKKAADAWRNTDAYYQAAQIIDMLVEELESDTLTQPNEPLPLEQLREMDVEKVWRGEWEEERFAGELEGWQHRECGRHSTEKSMWCPKCGKAMTDKAVDMVMERLEALYEQ